MSRKPIHVTVTLPFRERVRLLFTADATVHILLQPTALGAIKVAGVKVAGKKVPREIDVTELNPSGKAKALHAARV